MRILVTGPQGSGKSTQAILLAQDLGVPYIAAGEIFRNLTLIDDSQKVEKIKNAMTRGELIPIDLASEIINKRLKQSDCERGFVLDGFPRNLAQIQKLTTLIERAVYLRVSDETCVRRLVARKRLDDRENLIKTRLAIYHQETAPLLEIFKKQNILLEVDGEKTVVQIHKDIISRLNLNDIH